MNTDHRTGSRQVYGPALLLIWLGLVAGWPGLAMAQEATTAVKSEYTFEECDDIDESGLRAELNSIAQQALEDERVDIGARVEFHWQALGVDALIGEQVAEAVREVREGEAYLSRLWSSWSSDKAKELAEQVTTLTFDSEPFQHAIAELSKAIANDVAQQMEVASLRSVSSALGCLQVFIGEQYSQSLKAVFISEVNAHVGDVDFPNELKPDVSLSGMHGGALAGVGGDHRLADRPPAGAAFECTHCRTDRDPGSRSGGGNAGPVGRVGRWGGHDCLGFVGRCRWGVAPYRAGADR